jgi:hypothetical protein
VCVCFFVLCNRHWFNRAPGPDPRGTEMGVTYLPSTISSCVSLFYVIDTGSIRPRARVITVYKCCSLLPLIIFYTTKTLAIVHLYPKFNLVRKAFKAAGSSLPKKHTRLFEKNLFRKFVYDLIDIFNGLRMHERGF